MHIEDITDAGFLAYQSPANAIFKGHHPELIMFLQHWQMVTRGTVKPFVSQ